MSRGNSVRAIIASLSSRGRMTIPVEVRRALGLQPGDRVALTIDGTSARLAPARFTLETVLASVDSIPGPSKDDVDDQINDAAEEHAERITRSFPSP